MVEFRVGLHTFQMRLLISLDTVFYKCIDTDAAPHWGHTGLLQLVFKHTSPTLRCVASYHTLKWFIPYFSLLSSGVYSLRGDSGRQIGFGKAFRPAFWLCPAVRYTTPPVIMD